MIILDTVFINGTNIRLVPRDCSVSAGKDALTRFLRSLVINRGFFTDCVSLRPAETLHPRDTIIFRVWLPETFVTKFIEEAKAQDVNIPFGISL